MNQTKLKGHAIFRRAMIVMLIFAGLITITGTSVEDEKSTPDTRELGVYSIVVTEYKDNGGLVTQENTSKFDDATPPILKKAGDVYYDEAGNITGESEDSDGDGTLDWSYTYTYNSGNLKTMAVYDKIKEGKLEAAQFFYDANGNLIKREADSSYDGATFTEEQRFLYEYEEISGKWKMTIEKLDENADGTFEYTNIFSNNDTTGNLENVKYYFGDETEPYSASSYTYVEVGGVWYIESAGTDLDNNGETDFSYAYEYDGNGNQTLIRGLLGDVEDGTVVSVTYSSYDTGNRLIRDKVDEDGDGKFESVVYYDYYDDGQLKSKKTDYDDNGKGEEFDLTYNWTYKTIQE
ncbi:MAG: hypothetical protein NT072_02865 [Deltaproteobacteria bacterium]|nr:hypothetical protein [Deltaproteobacteria bacterium]